MGEARRKKLLKELSVLSNSPKIIRDLILANECTRAEDLIKHEHSLTEFDAAATYYDTNATQSNK